MKNKVIATVLAAALAVTMLAGCGNTETPAATDSTGTTESTDAADTTDAADAAGDFDTEGAITVISREEGSGTRGAFIELFGVEEKNDAGEKIDNTTLEAVTTNNTSVMMTSVAGDEYAIGYISLGSLKDTVKAVTIDGVEPTAENVSNGSYKIARPFNLVTKEGTSEVAQDFIDFIMSTEGQAVVTENGYIALDNTESYAGNAPEGKIVVAGSSSISPVMEKLKEAYEKVNTNATIEIQTSDSTTGVTSTVEGICDIGMASRELKDSELAEGVTGTVMAMDGIAVIVNKANPVNNLTSEQVKSIYVGDSLTWAEVAE